MLALALLALALQQTPEPPAAPPSPPAAAPAPPPAPSAAPAPRPAASGPRAERPPPAQPKEEPILTGFERRSGKRFSGDFDDAEVGDALRQIAEAADWSIVLPPNEDATISARFKNAPVEDALKAVLAQTGLAAAREGSIVTVRPRSTLPGLGRDLSRSAQRIAEEARRQAERATRDVEREMRRLERETSETNDRVIHGDVVIHAGDTARDVVAIRGSIKVEPGAEIRDAVAVLGSVVLESGAMAREVVAVGGDVRLAPGAEIANDVVSVGGTVDRDASASIGGETVAVGVPALSSLAGLLGSRMMFGQEESPAFRVGQALAKFLVYFALGLLVLALFPRRLDVVSGAFVAHPWKSIFTGLLGFVVLPLLLVLLVATVIGIPLVPVAALLVVAAGVLGFTALAWYIGRALPVHPRRGTAVLQLALGTAIVVLVTQIPLLGGMAFVAAALLGFGAVLRSRFGSQPAALATAIPPAAPPPPPPAAPPPPA
jgi:hypothetical protein